MTIIDYNNKIEILRNAKQTCKPLFLNNYMMLKDKQLDLNCRIENNKTILSIFVFPFFITFYFYALDFLEKIYNNYKITTDGILQYISENSTNPNLITEVSQKVESATKVVNSNQNTLGCVLVLITIASIIMLLITIKKSKEKSDLDKELSIYEYVINEKI